MLTYRKKIGFTDWKVTPLLPVERLALTAYRLFSEACLYSPETGNSVYAPILNRQQFYRYLSIEIKEVMTYREIISLPPNAIYLDVGANIGLYCCLAYLSNPKRILAFEPLPSNLHSLMQLKLLNDMSCLSVYGSPLFSNSDCLVPLEVPSSFAAAATGAQIRSAINPANPAVILKTLSLDEVISKENITNVDLIKLDVDGLELSILNGATSSLAAKVFSRIICEVQPDDYESIKEFLESFGYKLINEDPTYKSKQLMKLNSLSLFDVPRNLLFHRK